MAKVDYFLKLGPIKGESQDHKHKEEIELDSWSWGETQSGTAGHGMGAGAGKVNMQDFHFVMRISKASPPIFLACATGEHLKEATLTCRKAGKDPLEYMIVKFTDLLISSFQTGGSGSSDVLPVDQCSFNFTKVEMKYCEQNADGSPGGATTKWYDQKQNKGG